RRAAREPETSPLRVHEQRVGDQAAPVLSQRLPLGEAPRTEKDRLAGGVPVEVLVERADVVPNARRRSFPRPYLELLQRDRAPQPAVERQEDLAQPAPRVGPDDPV